MKAPGRRAAALFLALVFAAGLLSDFVAAASYATQFRDQTDAGMSGRFPLGTDALGRDRFARLLYGTRVSLLLAPAAAALAAFFAALTGSLAAWAGGAWDRLAGRALDLMLSLPWLFLLVAVRALLPLNVAPLVSVAATFAVLAALGWAPAARVVRARVHTLRNADFVLAARARGCPAWRVLLVQVLPNLRPVLISQFWISIPLFILGEAELGVLGLGVAEPLPSWGNMLRELATASTPGLAVLAPLGLMVAVVASFRAVLPAEGFER